jgi:purine-binding chemotaxis protein CheW
MNTSENQFIIACLGTEQFGIDISYIESIIVMQPITRVPKSQPYYLGVINLRGDVIPVMSLANKLGKEQKDFTPVSRIIIVKPDKQAAPAGIIVDEVREVAAIEESEIKPMSYDESDERVSYSNGVAKYMDDLINLLNIPGILEEKEA